MIVDPDNTIFTVLDLLRVRLFGPYWWDSQPLDSPDAKGVIFYAYEHGGDPAFDVASLAIADVSMDLDEPDIDRLEPSDIDSVDHILRESITNGLRNNGIAVVRWMSSHLNEVEGRKGLVTAYIVRDQGKDRQHIALRMKIKNRKLAVAGCFDIALKNTLASPLFDAMRSIESLE